MVCPAWPTRVWHVVDREVALAHGDGQVTHTIAGGGVAGSMRAGGKKCPV